MCSIQSLERLIWFIIFYYIVKQLTLTFQGHMLFFLMEFNKLFQIIWYFGYVNCCWTIATGINMHLIIGLKRNKTHCFPWCQSLCVFYTFQLKKIKQFMYTKYEVTITLSCKIFTNPNCLKQNPIIICLNFWWIHAPFWVGDFCLHKGLIESFYAWHMIRFPPISDLFEMWICF